MGEQVNSREVYDDGDYPPDEGSPWSGCYKYTLGLKLTDAIRLSLSYRNDFKQMTHIKQQYTHKTYILIAKESSWNNNRCANITKYTNLGFTESGRHFFGWRSWRVEGTCFTWKWADVLRGRVAPHISGAFTPFFCSVSCSQMRTLPIKLLKATMLI